MEFVRDEVETFEHLHGSLRDWVRVAILGGLGGYFTYNIVSGNVTNYINERFVWLSYVAAGLFLALAVSNLLKLLGERHTDHDHNHDHDDHHHDHDHNHDITWVVLATAAIPLVLGVMIPSRPLGAAAVNGNISTSASVAANAADFSIAPENRNILDWLREFGKSSDYAAFSGQPADVSGFVYREPDFPENHFMVARFTVSCCVADASALGLPVNYADASSLEDGAWVRVSGTIEAGEFNGDTVPVIQNAAVESIDTPEHPYLYP